MKLTRIISAVLALLMTAFLGACAEGTVNAGVSMYDLQKAMLEADETLPDMSTANSSAEDAEELFSYLSDMNYSKVESFFLAYSSTGLADEIAVIRVKNERDCATALETLKAHAEGRVRLYHNYMPTEEKRAEDALIFSEGSYAVLIISKEQKSVKSAFYSMIEG